MKWLFILLLFPLYAVGQKGSFCDATNMSGSLTYSNQHDLTISGFHIKADKDGQPCIKLTNCYNITIVNCIIDGQCKPQQDVNRTGIETDKCHDITVKHCLIQNTATGCYFTNYQGSAANMKVDSNYFQNMMGPYPRGAYVQFNSISGSGCSVSYNVGSNIFKQSYPEDGINLYKCNGTASSPIKVWYNKLRGGGPSTTGSGITIGDQSGSYQDIQYNVLVLTGNIGIQTAGASNITIKNNNIYSQETKYSHLGLGSGNYTSPYVEATNLNMSHNTINWTDKTGNPKDTSHQVGTPEPTDWHTNQIQADIGPDMLPVIMIPTCTVTPNPSGDVVRQEPNGDDPTKPDFNKQTVNDANLRAMYTFYIPHGYEKSLNGGKDSTGALFFNMADTSLNIRMNQQWYAQKFGASGSSSTSGNQTWTGVQTFNPSVTGPNGAFIVSPYHSATANSQLETSIYINPTYKDSSFTGSVHIPFKIAFDNTSFAISNARGRGIVSLHAASTPTATNPFLYSDNKNVVINAPDSTGTLTFRLNGNGAAQIFPKTGNFQITKGAFVDSGFRLEVVGTGRFAQPLSLKQLTVGASTDSVVVHRKDGTLGVIAPGSGGSGSVNVTSADLVKQTTAVNVLNYTVGSQTGTFQVGGYLNIISMSNGIMQLQIDYTDENNLPHSMKFFDMGVVKASLDSPGNSMFPPVQLRCNAASTITVRSVIVGGGAVNYDAGATIQQLK